MNREQAVTLIKEIFEECRFIEGKSIKLMPPIEKNVNSNTFQIHIQTNGDCSLESCIEAIANRHNLAVKQKDSLRIMYKPYPSKIKS